MNKRGDGDFYVISSKWIYYIISMLIIAFCLFVIVGRGASFLQSKAAISESVEEDIYIARLVNVCLVYEENGRVHPNVLDKTKITKEQVTSCLGESMSVTVESLDGSFKPIIVDVTRVTPEFSYTRYVILKDEKGMYPAHLTVKI